METSSVGAFLRPNEVLRKIGLRAEQTLVHLGCGAGFWLIPAAEIVGASGQVIGIDVRPDILSEAEGRARLAHVDQTVRTVRGDLEQVEGSRLGSNLADVVLIANIVHQVDPSKLLIEAKRLLKSAGRIVIVEWDVAASPIGPPPNERVSEPDMRKIIDSMGLAVAESFAASPYHYGLIVQKSQ